MAWHPTSSVQAMEASVAQSDTCLAAFAQTSSSVAAADATPRLCDALRAASACWRSIACRICWSVRASDYAGGRFAYAQRLLRRPLLVRSTFVFLLITPVPI